MFSSYRLDKTPHGERYKERGTRPRFVDSGPAKAAGARAYFGVESVSGRLEMTPIRLRT